MALPIYLSLEIDGNNIQGETTVVTIGGIDASGMIECLSVFHELAMPTQRAGFGPSAGRREHSPVTITKRVDRSSPLLYQALAQNQTVNLAHFRFFRPAADSGETQHFFSIHLESGRVSAIRLEQLSTVSPEYAEYPQLERVSFVFANISWTHELYSVSFTDQWDDRA